MTARATIQRVEYTECTKADEVHALFMHWQQALGVPPTYLTRLSLKTRYVSLIWLTNPHHLEPFEIDKTRYGTGAAWITLPSIETIRRR